MKAPRLSSHRAAACAVCGPDGAAWELTTAIQRALEEVPGLANLAGNLAPGGNEASGTVVELSSQGLATPAPGIKAIDVTPQGGLIPGVSQDSVVTDTAAILSELCRKQLSLNRLPGELAARVSVDGQGARQGTDEDFVHHGGDMV